MFDITVHINNSANFLILRQRTVGMFILTAA